MGKKNNPELFAFGPAELDAWWGLAACMDHPKADWWFADTRAAEEEREAARNICKMCPVATKCLTYAMEHPELEGMWGGVTWAERRRAVAKTAGTCGNGHDKSIHSRWMVDRWRCGACMTAQTAARKARAAERRAA